MNNGHRQQTIRKYDFGICCIAGPGGGGLALESNTYLDGRYRQTPPDVGRDRAHTALDQSS